MLWVTAHGKALQIQERLIEGAERKFKEFETWITSCGVHELLFDPRAGSPPPLFPALLAARARMERAATEKSIQHRSSSLVWIDPAETFYPPAVGPLISSLRLYLLRPSSADLIWTAIECLRSERIGCVVVPIMQRPTRVEVRRMQLAAEKGGGTGILLRPNLAGAGSHIYAATTRWLITPARGDRTIQRWNIEMIHGHGGQVGDSFILEKHRDSQQTNLVRVSAPLVHHAALPAAS